MLALALTAFGLSLSPPVSDDVRWVALQRDATTIEVRDDLEVRRHTLKVDRDCRPQSISHAGTLLVACRLPRIELIDVVSGAREHAQTPMLGGQDSLSAVAAGRYWIAERLDGYHFSVLQYRSRLTGEVRMVDSQSEHADVDAEELARPFCAPLVRFATPDDPYLVRGPFWPLGYDGEVGYFGKRLWRCGEARPRTFRQSRGLTAGGGWATWRTGDDVRAQRLRNGRRLRWRASRDVAVVHTARAVYVTHGRRVSRARFP